VAPALPGSGGRRGVAGNSVLWRAAALSPVPAAREFHQAHRHFFHYGRRKDKRSPTYVDRIVEQEGALSGGGLETQLPEPPGLARGKGKGDSGIFGGPQEQFAL